ncbi:MAG: RpiB/LacA/LacB family sugar-phosphate isomerase [Candidatus Parcubacteria bacterium]|nr:RpiB/LacA/LacB family sugar-phosphate isomerase [Candidatus Parcubacteria bacterium]
MLYLGADHAGFKLKEQLKKYLLTQKIKFADLGNLKLDKNDDYPDFGFKVAKAVSKDDGSKGILICGSSFGVCIVANKVKGIRAVSISNIKDAKLSREHNDANVLCLSGWDLKLPLAQKIIKIWLDTKFNGAPRHKRRLNKISRYES